MNGLLPTRTKKKSAALTDSNASCELRFFENQLPDGLKILKIGKPPRFILVDGKLVPKEGITSGHLADQVMQDAEITAAKMAQATQDAQEEIRARERRQRAVNSLKEIQRQLPKQ